MADLELVSAPGLDSTVSGRLGLHHKSEERVRYFYMQQGLPTDSRSHLDDHGTRV